MKPTRRKAKKIKPVTAWVVYDPSTDGMFLGTVRKTKRESEQVCSAWMALAYKVIPVEIRPVRRKR